MRFPHVPVRKQCYRYILLQLSLQRLETKNRTALLVRRNLRVHWLVHWVFRNCWGEWGVVWRANARTHARTQAPHIVPCRSLALSTDQNWFHTKTTPPSIRSPGKSSVDTRSLRQIYSLVAFNRYATTHTRTTHLCALSERAPPCELALLSRALALIKHYNDSVVDACEAVRKFCAPSSGNYTVLLPRVHRSPPPPQPQSSPSHRGRPSLSSCHREIISCPRLLRAPCARMFNTSPNMQQYS